MEQRLSVPLKQGTYEYGKYFESWIINEVIRLNYYFQKDWKLSFLRTANDVEVDLIIETPKGVTIGIEIKSKPIPVEVDFNSGFRALKSLRPKAKCICVCTGIETRRVESVLVIHYTEFFEYLASL